MHMPEASVRFGLMLEAYCRGAVAHIKSLLRQVCILKNIHTSTFVVKIFLLLWGYQVPGGLSY